MARPKLLFRCCSRSRACSRRSHRLVTILATTFLLGGLVNRGGPVRAETGPPKERSFRLTYHAELTGLADAEHVRVWLPLPPSNDWQQVQLLSEQLPGQPATHVEPRYGNRLRYCELRGPLDDSLTLRLTYLVRRREVRGEELANAGKAESLSDDERRLFLSANRLVPLGGKPLGLLEGLELPREPLALTRVLYDRVGEHMRYDKSRPGFGRGDAVWACDSRFGNCTDFHSLFIALARSHRVPARFEIGFALPPERGGGSIGGYHCWGMFHVEGRGWLPVDISEADKHPELKDYYFGNLTENRVAFSVGRDLTLVPRQAGPPLNFFVYPYVEADDKPLTQEQLRLDFRFEDI